MVSLGDESHRSGGGYFFEEGPGSIQSQEQEDAAPLVLGHTVEQTAKTINTTIFIVLEILILLKVYTVGTHQNHLLINLCPAEPGYALSFNNVDPDQLDSQDHLIRIYIVIQIIIVWVCSFVLPAECGGSKCGADPSVLVLYIVAAIWFVQLILDRYYRYQHYQNRLYGYLNFYRRTANIRRVPLMIASAANAILLIATQILVEKCGDQSKCGPLNREHYYQIIISVSCAIQILLLFIYLIRTMSFNRSGAAPDVNQEDMVTSFLQTNSSSHDIGFKDDNYTDQILERQADVIRYLKQHNIQLGKKILELTEENKSLRQSK